MSTDLRTEFNDADSVTGWTGQGKEALNTTTGQYYEGTGSIEDQRSNSDEETYYTAGASVDLSDSTCYLLSKDNLVDSYANGGVQFLIGDGTDTIGYDVGGFDAPGMPLQYYYNVHKLDVSERGNESFATYGGSEANLTVTAITEMGIGTLHLAKAVGSIANCWIDRMAYHANGSYALRINGGTVGTPETMADVQGDDETNGWGLVNNPVGSQYQFIGPTEWGEPAANADVYFTADGEQWFWIGDNAGGHTVGATHFPFRIVGNATDTVDITWTNLVITNTGTRAEFTVGDTNCDIDFDSITFTDLGAITFAAQAVSRTHDIIIFNNCDQVTPNGCNGSDWTFNGTTDANGAMLLDTAGDSDNIAGIQFFSDGTGHAIYITATGTYDFDNFTFDSYGADDTTDAAVYNNSGGAVTINVQNGGDTPTVRNGASASTTINNAVTIRIDGVAEGTAVTMIANETAGTVTSGDVLLEGIADSTGGYEDTGFNYEGAFGAGLDVLVRARNQGLAQAAVADDGGSQTDETANANSPTTDDMTLTPATPAVNDAYYFGHNEEFNQLKVWVSSAGSNQTITWEYWNGAWTALSGVSDGTSSFTTAGDNTVSWTLPGDWADTTVNSQGPYRYVRARVSAVGGGPTGASGRQCQLDVTRYLPIPPSGLLIRTITSAGLTVTLAQAEDTISRPFG